MYIVNTATLTISSDSETFTTTVRETVAGFLATDGQRWPTKREQLLGAYSAARIAAKETR